MALTARQERFAAEFPIDLNATRAAIRAGYSGATAQEQGSRLLRHAGVGAVIAEKVSDRVHKMNVTTELVLSGLLAEARYRGKGSSHAARVAAWAKLGEYLKLFTQRTENHNRSEVDVRVERMTPDERRARIKVLAAKAGYVPASEMTTRD